MRLLQDGIDREVERGRVVLADHGRVGTTFRIHIVYPSVERRGDKAVDVVGLADQRARRLYDQTRRRKEVVEHALICRHPLLGGVQLVKRELSAYRLAHLGKTSRRRRARRVGEGQHLFGVKTRPVPSVAQEENAVDRRLLQHVQRGIEVGFEKTAHIVSRVVRHQGMYLSVHAIVRDIAEAVGGKVRAARRSAKPRERAKLLIHRAGVDAPRRAAVFAEDIEEQVGSLRAGEEDLPPAVDKIATAFAQIVCRAKRAAVVSVVGCHNNKIITCSRRQCKRAARGGK